MLAMVGVVIVTRHSPPSGTPYVATEPWRGALWVCIVGAVLTWIVGLVVVARRVELVRLVVAIAICIQAVPLFAPLLFSGDAQGYVKLARSHHPYAGPPWYASPYGTWWTLLSHAIVTLRDPVIAFRVLAFLAVVALIVLISRISAAPTVGVILLGWNPLVAIHFSGAGHNDAVTIALFVAALYAAERGWSRLAGVGLIGSFFIKLYVAPFIVLALVQSFRRGRRIDLAACAVTLLASVGLSFLIFGSGWLQVFHTAEWNERQPWAFGLTGWFEDLGIRPATTVTFCRVVEGALVAAFLVQAWRGSLRLGLVGCLMTMVSPRFNAWYALGAIAFSAIDARDRWARGLVVVITIVALSDILTPALNA